MKILIFFVFIFVFYLPIQKKHVNSQQQGIDSEDGDAATFFNKSYSEHQSSLELKIFRGYNPKTRPVKNISQPIVVDVHWHIIHVSINQLEQTMTVHGHIYMRWYDEFLVWDPKDFNGIHYARVKKWQVWQPKIKVSNSASGLGSAFDFSTSAHVIIQMIEKDRAKVEMYPTFSIKVGCSFDFGDFPNDANKCAVNLFSTATMNEVQLQNLYSIPPTLSFGWEEQKMKRIISDFKIQNVSCSSFYYSQGNISNTAPVTGFDAGITWSMLAITVNFVRHSPLFFSAILAPCWITAVITVLSFYIISIPLSIYMLIMNTYVQMIFFNDFTKKLPLTLSKTPPSVTLFHTLVLSNGAMIFVQALLLTFQHHRLVVPLPLQKIYIVKEYMPMMFKEEAVVKKEEATNNWGDWVKTARPLFGLVLLIFYVIVFVLFAFIGI
ncbi:CRE-CUP-4 protein [Caenorhabditis remanei]|uniref:Acetylcholine receptor-like protein cup-4 n=1 Tax=Caenorhabditis remanei TaxID=31234 RepID=E3MKW1_CAERE|nr:CRE-CUP-4 protein [Caenorhabditis remanei]